MCRKKSNLKGTVVKYILEYAVSTLIYVNENQNWKKNSREILQKNGRIRVIVNRMIVKSLKCYVLSISSIIWK